LPASTSSLCCSIKRHSGSWGATTRTRINRWSMAACGYQLRKAQQRHCTLRARPRINTTPNAEKACAAAHYQRSIDSVIPVRALILGSNLRTAERPTSSKIWRRGARYRGLPSGRKEPKPVFCADLFYPCAWRVPWLTVADHRIVKAPSSSTVSLQPLVFFRLSFQAVFLRLHSRATGSARSHATLA
jgi:hypothetical protein